MRKLLLCLVAMAAAMAAVAQETVKTLYYGGPREVSWENTLKIPADEFQKDVNIGDYIYITFSQTSDVIEIKANGVWLPGSRFTFLGDNATDFKAYITADMLSALRQDGLEICGAKFTVTSVSICNDGFVMPENAIWGGYFWIDNWNTLEIFKTAFTNYAGQRYMDIYLSEDTDGYDGYFMKVLTRWEPETLWANNDQIIHTPRMATVDLKGIDVPLSLGDVNALMIQGNKENRNPFNITAVALRSEGGTTDVMINETISDSGIYDIFNCQGVLVESGVSISEAMNKLPAGLYIANGKKFLLK